MPGQFATEIPWADAVAMSIERWTECTQPYWYDTPKNPRMQQDNPALTVFDAEYTFQHWQNGLLYWHRDQYIRSRRASVNPGLKWSKLDVAID